jgi:hypothetical protein
MLKFFAAIPDRLKVRGDKFMSKQTKTVEAAVSGPNGVMEKCVCTGCKASASRFSFCTEHFDHFKFGLIKKTGERVSDYEKKLGHFEAFKKSAQKAA